MQLTDVEIRVLLTSITRQLRGLYDGANWVAENLSKRLGALTEVEAFTVPTGHSTSIAQQLLHMAAWRQFVIEQLKKNEGFDVNTAAADWPTPQQWPATLAAFAVTQTELLTQLEQFDIGRWHAKVPGRAYNFGFMLQGVIHHDFYHYGQIGAALAALGRAKA